MTVDPGKFALAPTKKSKKRPRGTAKLALRALDKAIYDLTLAIRWKVVAENSPRGSRMDLRAWDEQAKAHRRAFDGFAKVRLALGDDPDADEPQPKRHWDAGA